MKNKIRAWQFRGFWVSALGGTLLHFLYDWLGESLWVAPFSGVNESTWEHMKLFFWPTFLYALFQKTLFKDREDFWCIKLCGILIGLCLIPVLFYTYNGAIAPSPDWINITIFFISAGIAYLYEYTHFMKQDISCKSPKIALTILWEIAVLFIIFTFATPRIGIFKDPITGSFGI